MIPPLPPTLQSEITAGTINLETTSIPAFVNLYRHLTTQTFDHDVSTQSRNLESHVIGVEDQLGAYRVQTVRDVVLVRVLRELDSMSGDRLKSEAERRGTGDGNNHHHHQQSDLNRDYELCHVVSAFLACGIAGKVGVLNDGSKEEVYELLQPELVVFRQRLSTVADMLGTELVKLDGVLVRMLELMGGDGSDVLTSTADVNVGLRNVRTRGSRIPSSVSTSASTRNHTNTATRKVTTSSSVLRSHRQNERTRIQTTLPDLLEQLSSTLISLLTTNTTLLTSAIRHSELYTYSTLSRYLTTQASFLASVAEGLKLKTEVGVLQEEKMRYAGVGVEEKLLGMVEVLDREERELEDREARLRELLDEYQERDEGLFGRLGSGYREVEGEIEKVAGDVRRLEREVGGDERRTGGGYRGRS